MKKLITLFSFLILGLTASQAQIYDPVSWNTRVEKTGKNTYNLITTASIETGWHVYSQVIPDPDNGPIPTEFNYILSSENGQNLVGSTLEGDGHESFDQVFQMDIKFFENKAKFVQQIESDSTNIIQGSVYFMVCDDTQCLPPDEVELSFDLSKATAANGENSDVKEVKQIAEPESQEERSLWGIFIIAFLSGFVALLTPCVFPMIPMTVSFFTKTSKTRAAGVRNAVIYGLSIIVLYVLLGTIVTWAFGADALNALSTNVWFNLIFFVLLIVFAFSFLGAFEIMLPQSWANKVDKQADRGGIIGIMFMALALAIVSFSCTGPIVGTLLVESATLGGLAPTVGMFGFSLAIALPFTLFAAFPGWMNSLPNSGGWLNTVKVFLGFLELAFAFKFLSNADLVLQLHLLEREVFIAIWVAIFGVLSLYLLGKIRLPHDSPLNHISVGRLSLALVTLTFTIYLIPGLWGAPLKLISGFPPPKNYAESPMGIGGGSSNLGGDHKDWPEGAHAGPHGIMAFKDYEKGLAYAQKVNKPIMIDFTGHACVNCRKMEDNVWSDPEVLQVLNNDLVLISLYVDDKRDLPENEQYISEISGKKVKSIGKKWSEFQIQRYKANAQPYYVLIDLNEENLNAPSAYNPDIEDYLSWLRDGLKNFK
ncbi:MAG: protein-disulfide reductase DsbD family protein [Flavobacteriaceae bacterium]